MNYNYQHRILTNARIHINIYFIRDIIFHSLLWKYTQKYVASRLIQHNEDINKIETC